MRLRILVLLLIAAAAVSCGKKKKGAFFLLPSLETPSLNNTVETPVEEVAPTPDNFQHPVVVDPATDTGDNTADNGTGTGDNTADNGTGSGDNTADNGTGTGDNTADNGTGTGDNTADNGTGSGDNTADNGTGTGDNTADNGTGTGDNTADNGTGTGDSSGLEGSESNPDVAVNNVSESEFKTDGLAMNDCIKNLPIPDPGKSGMVKYDDFTKNLCEINGVWYVVIPWDFKDGNFKMHIEKKIPKAKYLLSAMFGTYDVDGYRDLMYPQRRATAPYSPVYNVDYTSQNWLVTSQDVFLIDIPTNQWINFDKNYALLRIFVDDQEVTTEDSRSALHMKSSSLVYDIPPPPSTRAAYLLQTGSGKPVAQTVTLTVLAVGVAGLIAYLARKRREV